MKALTLCGLFVLAIFMADVAHANEYEQVIAVACDFDPDQAFRVGLVMAKGSVRNLAARCNAESTGEVVVLDHHTIVVDPSVPDEICGLVQHGPSLACGWFIKEVLIGNGLAPIQERAHVVRIVPLKSVKPGQPLADMSW